MRALSLFLFFVIVGVIKASDPPEKIKYLDTVASLEDMKIRLVDAISTEDFVKTKVYFENKNEYFILVEAGKSFFYINGEKFVSKEKEIVIPPSGKRSKVFDTKVKNTQSHAISFVLDGISKTADEKTINLAECKIVNDSKILVNDVELIIVDVDYDKANRLNIKIKIKNAGANLLIVNPAVVEVREQENLLNNIRKRSNKVLLRKDETEVMVLSFQTNDKGSEKFLVWNDIFSTASITPLSAFEIALCTNLKDLEAYKYYAPILVKAEKAPEVKEIPVATSPLAKAKRPEKAGSGGKKAAPVKKAQPIKPKAETPTQPNKRAVESEERELHASDIDFGDAGGKFFALLIGVSDYTDPGIADLDGLPVKDALALEKVLVSNYTFNLEDIKVLKSPTRREIVIALDNLSKTVGPLDNVLIFYAGHGHYEDDNDIGYWLPKDAEVSNSANWLYNDQLVAGLRKIKSLHTLLITDACFSGSIFKSRSISFVGASDVIKKKYQLPSRKAMTSGTLKTVPNKSVFIKYLVDRLEKNKAKYYPCGTLFQEIEVPVANNSNSLPQFGVIQNVGDEGGDFIFIKR